MYIPILQKKEVHDALTVNLRIDAATIIVLNSCERALHALKLCNGVVQGGLRWFYAVKPVVGEVNLHIVLAVWLMYGGISIEPITKWSRDERKSTS